MALTGGQTNKICMHGVIILQASVMGTICMRQKKERSHYWWAREASRDHGTIGGPWRLYVVWMGGEEGQSKKEKDMFRRAKLGQSEEYLWVSSNLAEVLSFTGSQNVRTGRYYKDHPAQSPHFTVEMLGPEGWSDLPKFIYLQKADWGLGLSHPVQFLLYSADSKKVIIDRMITEDLAWDTRCSYGKPLKWEMIHTDWAGGDMQDGWKELSRDTS